MLAFWLNEFRTFLTFRKGSLQVVLFIIVWSFRAVLSKALFLHTFWDGFEIFKFRFHSVASEEVIFSCCTFFEETTSNDTIFCASLKFRRTTVVLGLQASFQGTVWSISTFYSPEFTNCKFPSECKVPTFIFLSCRYQMRLISYFGALFRVANTVVADCC